MFEWLLEVGTFKCQRWDCPKPKGTDCPLCEMPSATREEVSLINLFSRCRNYGVLPTAGSLLDQPVELMDCFDILNGVIEKKKTTDAEKQRSDMMKEQMKRELA